MAEEVSHLRGAVAFLDTIGIYDVVLPFILIFTVTYAVLEKSRIFGVEKVGGEEVTRKNLNSMFAFVTAFLVVASTQIVAAINKSLASIVLLMMLGISILLLAGTFHTGTKEFKLDDTYRNILVGIMFIGTILIFLWSITTEEGKPWLVFIYEFILLNWDTGAAGALILALIMIGFIMWVTQDPTKAKKAEKKEE